MKAKIDRLLSDYNYIMAFHYSVDTGDKVSLIQTNLNIAINRLRGTDFDAELEKHNINVNGKGAGGFKLEQNAAEKVFGGEGLKRSHNLVKQSSMASPDTGRSSPTFGKMATQDSDFSMKAVEDANEETKVDNSNCKGDSQSNSNSPLDLMKRVSQSEVPSMSKSASNLGVAHHKVAKGQERPNIDEIME